MGVQFLSSEWAEAVTTALNAHAGFKAAIGSADLGIQFNVNGAPGGDVDYHLKTSGGSVRMAIGNLEGADVTVANSYETASAISQGELNTQTAFMAGKLKVTGNLAKLMMHQGAVNQWAEAVKEIPVDY